MRATERGGDRQAVLWEPTAPPSDSTAIVRGGAVVVIRLSPDEVEQLHARGRATLVDAIHDMLSPPGTGGTPDESEHRPGGTSILQGGP